VVGQGALFGPDLVGDEVARCRTRRVALERAVAHSGVVVVPSGRTFEVACSTHGTVSRHQTTEAYAVERAASHIHEHHG